MKGRIHMIPSPSPRLCRIERGFTLVEVMIVVAIIAILASVAYPSYTDYVRRGKISQATSELSTWRVRLEQFYQDRRSYGSTATTCGVAAPTAPAFTFTCTWGATSSDQSFIATATGTAAGGMNGFAFTVDQANAQTTTAFAGTSATLPANCWMKNRGDAC